ncbi:hypothetical protein PF005_g10363 [Phytophthora fragariae]|uniref:Uncharacterized protein n=1 Tax=Phytophthora fragariae TaxID=53985 RepID=A0A6A3Y6P1_9STRA|nr:hypothetical protein PF005_g10363 [Phytophthora fragariae]
MELDFKLDSMLWTSVAVVYRECLLKRSGEQLPHVARHIDGFLDDRSRSLAAAYERTASLHCIQLLADRRAAPESLYIEWEFNTVVAQAARRGDLASLKWLAESYLQDGALSAAANAAAFSGELSVLQWLHEEHKARVHWGGLEWCGAIRSGQTEVVEWLKQNTGGHLSILEWLHANGADACSPSAMKDAVLGSHVPVMLFLYNNYGRELCEAGICLLRDNWEDTEVRFVGMAQWLLNNFGEELEGVTMSVNRADWATNKWMKDHNMSMLEVEDEIVFWECGPQ